LEGCPEVTIVGDDQHGRGACRSGGGSRLIDDIDENLVCGSASRVPNDQSRRDPLATKAGLRHAVEDQLDCDWGRDRRPEATDERGRWRWTPLAR
jgi:hypothetical protein